VKKQSYGHIALFCTWVFKWYARFRDGHKNLEEDKQSGQPTAIQTPDMIKTVCDLISTDC
jgi:hypothetical protein